MSGAGFVAPEEQGDGGGGISVIIPTYNRADLLPRAIASALGQSRPPCEVIVVDDGSTDDTAARCAEWGDRIRYLRMTNSGVAAARNAGMALAVGDWIALLDSDDAWEPTKLEVQMAAHARTPEAAWSVTGCEVVDATDAVRAGPRSFAGAFLVFQELGRDPEAAFDEHLTRVEVTAAGGRHLCFTGDLFGLLFHGNVCLPSSAVIHRRVLERLGPFDPSLRVAEETEFFHRVASAFPVTIVMSPLVRYRAAQEGSLTAGVNIGRLTEAALHSLDAAARLRALSPVEERARVAGRRKLLLRLAYAQLSVRDGAAARRTLRRLAADRLPLGRRGAAIWAASLLPAPALAAMHAGKRLLRRRRARRGAS